MIKMITLIKRHPRITHQEFADHWKNVHAPIAMNNPDIEKYIFRYTQNYLNSGSDVASQQFGGLALPAPPFDFDGIMEVWFESMDDLKAMTSSPTYFNVLKPDEDSLVDKSKCLVYIVEEHTFINKSKNMAQ
ncbi:MAG: EthD domain-containing protein [Novosphingobium sp.]